MTRSVWTPAYIGLGSNLADPVAQLTRAVDKLAELPGSRLTAVSAFVVSAPLGPRDQPDYVNAVAAILTLLEPRQLLAECQDIEARQQRRRDGTRWGPRTLDLDLLVFGDEQIDSDDLHVPHPEIASRAFVLGPLREIAPSLRVPGFGTVANLAATCDLDAIAPLRAAGHVA